MTESKRASYAKWLLLLMALAPAFFLAHLGSYSRLLSDDFSKLALAREHGAWQGMRYWRDVNSGSYSYTLLHGLAVPLDDLPPRIAPALIIALWVWALAWLLRHALRFLGVARHQGAISVGLAALIVAAAINAFYIPHTFYWFSANTRYVLPLAFITLSLALALEAAARYPQGRGWIGWALAGGICCFVSAGFAEMIALAQATVLALLLILALVFLKGGERRRYTAALRIYCLATGASLITLFTAPGAYYRMEVNAENAVWSPVRALPDILIGALDLTFQNVGHLSGFAGFMLALAAALFLTLRVYDSGSVGGRKRALTLKAAPLSFGLLAQVCFIPILWTHSSDNVQVFGRFSVAFLSVVGINAALIALFLLLLWRRRQLDAWLRGRANGWQLVLGGALAIILLLFALTQLRSIHYKAAAHLYLSVLATLLALCWQLSCAVPDRRARLCGVGALLSFGLTLAVLLVLSAAALYTQGVIQPRIMSSVAFLQVAGGLLWGAWLGMLLKESGLLAGAASRWTSILSRLSLALAIVIGAGMVYGHAQSITNLAAFADEWDARHEMMLAARASGSDMPVPELTIDITEFFCCSNQTSRNSAELYYFGFAPAAEQAD